MLWMLVAIIITTRFSIMVVTCLLFLPQEANDAFKKATEAEISKQHGRTGSVLTTVHCVMGSRLRIISFYNLLVKELVWYLE